MEPAAINGPLTAMGRGGVVAALVTLAVVLEAASASSCGQLGAACDNQTVALVCNTSNAGGSGPCGRNAFACKCSARCNELVNCSGHGRCSGLAAECKCDAGWSDRDCSKNLTYSTTVSTSVSDRGQKDRSLLN